MNETVVTSKVEFHITQERQIQAPIDAVFTSLLAQLGPETLGEHRQPLPMKLEEFPGGRWYRDLGDGNGHFWGQVQAIKRPTLLELTGPFWMSQAVCNNLQYRLEESGGYTSLRLTHSCMGTIPDEVQGAIEAGWAAQLDRIVAQCE